MAQPGHRLLAIGNGEGIGLVQRAWCLELRAGSREHGNGNAEIAKS